MINFFKFLIGTVIGSFITLSGIRINRHESFVFPPSHCDNCGHRLKFWELIPIISFLTLRGKCHQCHQPIGLLTLIGETTGGLITLINPLSTFGILEMTFELALLFIAECDYYSYYIPIEPLLALFLITIVIKIQINNFQLTTLALTLIFYIITLIIVNQIHGFGNGDVDLIFILFFRTNLRTVLLILIISSTLAIIKYVIHHNYRVIPYTPYLTVIYLLLQLCN